jgi:hypothetical protein
MGKVAYRVKNWKSYNNALIHRGSLSVWIEEEAIGKWLSTAREARRGRPFTYSDVAIETGLALRTLWKIPLRMAQGLLARIFKPLNVDLPTPNYTTLCRRAGELEVNLKVTPSQEVRHLVIE